jgi:hypothetical protein
MTIDAVLIRVATIRATTNSTTSPLEGAVVPTTIGLAWSRYGNPEFQKKYFQAGYPA